MLQTLYDKLQKLNTNEEKFNYLREYCQLLILKILDDIGGFKYLAFVGGTALRILYDLKRFSEDLDFCLINSEGYMFSQLMSTLENELRHYNINCEIRYKDHKTIASAFIKFNNLMNEAGLTPHPDQKLMIKFEVDQNPPSGYNTELTMISQDFLAAINHFDLPTLYAGKLHAVLCRKYTKGRDYYDLIWYLGRKIKPNYTFLNNAIQQTEKGAYQIDESNFSAILKDKIKDTDFEKVKYDLTPFLMDSTELKYFEKPLFLSLIK